MSWDDLNGASGWLRIRPIASWPGTRTTPVVSSFSAQWWVTVELLRRELDHLGAERAILELALRESDLRVTDGLPKARAVASHPGAILSFRSTHGPLRYATAKFAHWQDNVRAIALALEALRKVDRYGVASAAEQYRGWLALPAGEGDLVSRGRALVAQHGGMAQALHATHPDHGGDPEDLRAVIAAREAART